MDAETLIATMGLSPHPEGGFYRETWKSPTSVMLPDGRERATATMIYFFLPAGASSRWHRVASAEIWLAHTGAVTLEYGGTGVAPVSESTLVVGPDVGAGQNPQALVPAGVWQRTVVSDADAMVSCMVSPGFDFADFELV